MDTFQSRLNEALDKRHMSAAELARLSKVNEGSISQYRKGKFKASQDGIVCLAKALNVPIPWLMGADMPSPFEDEKYENELLNIFRTLNDTAKKELVGCLHRKNLNINEIFAARSLTQEEREYLEMYRALPEDEQKIIKRSIKWAYQDLDIEAQEKGIG